MPFDLHPEYPPEGIPRADLERRYGPGLVERHRSMFAEAGLPFAATLDKVPNSRRALMLGELARERGAFEALHPRLFDAYWGRGLDIGDEDVLVQEAAAVGLERDEVLDGLREERFAQLVDKHTLTATGLGAGGVPAWLIDLKLLVPGAQPHAVFERALEQLGRRPVAD